MRVPDRNGRIVVPADSTERDDEGTATVPHAGFTKTREPIENGWQL
jgi:hypothetical protein